MAEKGTQAPVTKIQALVRETQQLLDAVTSNLQKIALLSVRPDARMRSDGSERSKQRPGRTK